MGNRKKMGKIEGHQQQGQKNPSQLSLEGAVLAAETDQITDVIDAVAAATAAAAASVTRAAIAVAASSSSTAVEATTAASTRAAVLETATAGVTTAQAVMHDVPDGFSDQGTKRIHKENDERQVGTLSKDVEIAVNEGSNVSRDESDGDPFIKTFGTEDMNKGDVVQTTDVSGDSVGTAHLDQYSLDVKCQRQENELGDNQALQQPQLQNAKQQQPQQQQHRNQQHQLHHPHTQQQKPNQNHHQQQQQLQQQQHHLSQFLQTTTNNTPTLSINRPQQQQQQGLISLPAIPAPCYVHQQTSGSTLQTMGVDFLQQANQQQLFSITNPAHQVIGQIPSIHFPAIASNQHQQNIIVPPSHNTPGVQPQPTTAPSLPSAPFKNIEQQNLLCQGLNQHQQHQQNIMQQIEWQIQLQKNHIRQQQQQQQQQQQLQNLRQNLQQQQQQLIQLQNSGMFYQHQLKQRQNQQQQHHQNNGHHNNPHHQHHQQQHLNMLQLRQHQFPPQNSKVDLLCSSLDAPIEKNNDVFRGNQKMHIAPHFHVQQQEQHQHSHLQSLQLQPPQQQKKKHKQEHQHIDQQQSSSVSMFESQQTTTGSTDGTHSVNASCTTSTTTVIGAAAATAATATTTSSNTTTVNQGVNLYVKHLDDDVDDSALKKMFSRFGEVVSAKVMMEGQMSRGFGFVCFARAEDAARATRDIRRKSDDLSSMKNLYVAPAQRKEERQAIFRERLRSFMEDTPPGAASQDHETKKFVKPPTVKERTSTLASEGPPTQAIPNSSEVSFDRPAGSHPMVPNGANAISTNTFLHNSKTKNIPSLQNSDGKNQCAQLNQEENVRRIPVNSSFSLLPNNRFDNIESRQHRPIKNIFDLDNFSLEKLNMPLLQTAAQTCPKVQKNSMYSSTVSLGNAKESQAEPIPQWFYGADEEDGGFGNDVITLYQRDELLDKNLDSDCFASATAMDNMNNEYPRWLKLPDYFDFPDESNQEHDSYLCQSDAGPEVIEQIKAGNHEMIEVNNADDIQLHTDPIESWSGNLHIWNCKLITKEDNQILKENDGDEEEEEVGALLENKEDCIGTLDDCNRLVKACISCCTDTDSCISGDEDIDQEYKESNSILDTKCNRSDYFRSSQNVQNNNSIIDDDASCPMSPLSKWTKSRKRCLSSDERIPAAAETRIYDMTNQPNTNTNAPTHCKIIVTPTTNTNKIRVLDLPVVVAPSRKDTKRNRKRKRTTTSLAGDVEDVVSPKRIRTQENNERPVVHNNCKRPRLC